jgi:hypothetical protein
MVATGYSRQLQDSDLPPPPPGASPAECGDALWRQWVKVRARLSAAALAGAEGGPPGALQC